MGKVSFYEEVLGAARPSPTKAGVISYYKREYPEYTTQVKGGKNKGKEIVHKPWQAKLAEQLSGTDDKKSRAYQSALRNFQKRGTQQAKVPKEETPKWKKVVEDLSFILPPPCGFHVSGTLRAKISESCIEREIDFDITKSNAKDLVGGEDDDDMLQMVMNIYMSDGAQGSARDDHAAIPASECGESELTITVIDCEE